MDQYITLCFECRKIFKDHWKVDVVQRDNKLKKACENCGERFDLRLCRIRTLPDKERGRL